MGAKLVVKDPETDALQVKPEISCTGLSREVEPFHAPGPDQGTASILEVIHEHAARIVAQENCHRLHVAPGSRHKREQAAKSPRLHFMQHCLDSHQRDIVSCGTSCPVLSSVPKVVLQQPTEQSDTLVSGDYNPAALDS